MPKMIPYLLLNARDELRSLFAENYGSYADFIEENPHYSVSELSKAFSGETNFTLKRLARLVSEMGGRVELRIVPTPHGFPLEVPMPPKEVPIRALKRKPDWMQAREQTKAGIKPPTQRTVFDRPADFSPKSPPIDIDLGMDFSDAAPEYPPVKEGYIEARDRAAAKYAARVPTVDMGAVFSDEEE